MSVTQATIGAIMATPVLAVALNLVLPDPMPIVVNSIAFIDGQVSQDRTVTTDLTALYAEWAATVIDASTGETVPGCEGYGAWPYAAGRKDITMSLERWVGSDTCTAESLPPGEYYLKAAWDWGTGGTSATSERFVVE